MARSAVTRCGGAPVRGRLGDARIVVLVSAADKQIGGGLLAVQSATFAESARVISVADFLATMPWFATLDALERRRVLSETTLKTVRAGACLARQGDPPTFWYGIIDGLLKL